MRARVAVSVGNVLELAAVGLLTYGVYLLGGAGCAFVTGAACCGVLAEFVYDGTVMRIPLPARKRNASGLEVIGPRSVMEQPE